MVDRGRLRRRLPVRAGGALHQRGFVPLDARSPRQRGGRKIPPIVDLLMRTVTVGSEALGRAARAQADILFKPPLGNIDLLDWGACDRAIEAGYRHAITTLSRLCK